MQLEKESSHGFRFYVEATYFTFDGLDSFDIFVKVTPLGV
jgi:hypothetical protein